MNHQLHFSERYIYDSHSDGITIPVVLKTVSDQVELPAKIDTGASDCMFMREYGELLGLRVEDGDRKTYASVNGRFEAYGHEVSISVLGIETRAIVYFFAMPDFGRNVLGRNGWLNRLRIGFVDHDYTVYLSGYDG